MEAFLQGLGTFLLFGTFWFWAFVVAVSIWIIISIESESGFSATFAFIVTLLALQFASDVDPISYVIEQPLQVLLYVGIYFVGGLVWSFIKWNFLFLTDLKEQYNDAKAQFLQRKGIAGTAIPEELLSEWRSYVSQGYRGLPTGTPRARDYKGDITRWATYWPWSVLWTMLDDVIKRVWALLYARFEKLFQSAANRKFADVEAELSTDGTDTSTGNTTR